MEQSEYSSKIQEFFISIDTALDPGFKFEKYNEDIRKAINNTKYDREPLRKAVLVQYPRGSSPLRPPTNTKKRALNALCSFSYFLLLLLLLLLPYKLAKFLDTCFRETTNLQPRRVP